jgi:lysozyme
MINKESKDLIKSFEACELHAYECATSKQIREAAKKFYTIGWGNTLYENNTKVSKSDVITQDRADALFEAILADFEKKTLSLVTAKLTENQKGALVSFAYNCGIANLKSSTLLKRVNEGKYDEAAKEFLKWNKSAGKVLNGLTRRRQAESALFMKP